MAVDGTGALSPVHIPSLSNYPEGLHPADDALAGRVHARHRQRRDLQAVRPECVAAHRRVRQGTRLRSARRSGRTGQAVWLRLVQVCARCGREAAGQERLQQERRRQVAAARRHALEDQLLDGNTIATDMDAPQLCGRRASSGRSSASTPTPIRPKHQASLELHRRLRRVRQLAGPGTLGRRSGPLPRARLLQLRVREAARRHHQRPPVALVQRRRWTP